MKENINFKGEYNQFTVNKDFRLYRFGVFSKILKKIFSQKIKNLKSKSALFIRSLIFSKIVRDLQNYNRTGNKNIINRLIQAGIILEHKYAENLIPTTGRNVLCRLLTGDVTYSGEVDWGALGNAVSPSFTNASTQLNTEVYRAQADSQAVDGNIVYIDWFIAAGDVADGTYTEFGAFIDGTASANSGQAWSLLATGGWVKSGSMFISGKYTLT